MQTTFGPDPSLMNWREFSLCDASSASSVQVVLQEHGRSTRTMLEESWRPLQGPVVRMDRLENENWGARTLRDEEDEEDGAEGIRGSKILVGDYNRLRFSLNKGNNDDATHGGHARHRNETEKLKEGVI